MSMWIADLERRFCDFLGIVPDDDDSPITAFTAVITPTGSSHHGPADGEHKPAPALAIQAPSAPVAPRRTHMTAGAGRARSKTHAAAAGPAVDAELGVLHQALSELRAGLDADAS
jgi:hypothetical protein